MEKFFSPSKWFVGFCGLFIIVWLALGYIRDQRIKEEAMLLVDKHFSYRYPIGDGSKKVLCEAQSENAKIIRRTTTDAQVQVSGKQIRTIDGVKTESAFKGSITLYKNENIWRVGQLQSIE